MISYNTYLKFLRFAHPEATEERLKELARKYMEQQHKWYRGTK